MTDADHTQFMLADSDERDTADETGRSTTSKRASHRGELVTIGGGNADRALAPWHARAARAEIEMRRMRADDCPSCPPGSYTHRHCRNRNDATIDHGLDDRPFCRHASADKVARLEKERVRSRYDRIARAGCRDEDILAIVPGAVRSLRPPEGWFLDPFGPARHDEATGIAAAVVAKSYKYRAVLLAGDVGSGKSVIAASALALCERAGLWIPATHVEDGERWRLLVSAAHGASCVVIDDLGRERNGWPVEALKSLITDLLDSSTPLIVTTNLADSAFAARYLVDPSPAQITGTRLRDRMQAFMDWIVLMPENLRARAAAERRRREGTQQEQR